MASFLTSSGMMDLPAPRDHIEPLAILLGRERMNGDAKVRTAYRWAANTLCYFAAKPASSATIWSVVTCRQYPRLLAIELRCRSSLWVAQASVTNVTR